MEMNLWCQDWLDAWTGNNLQKLLSFYSDDIFYSDPAVLQGLKGIKSLSDYLKRLLAANPDWRWRAVELMPTEKGFTLKWEAFIPIGDQTIHEFGLDIVELASGRITRNEVYFDRSRLLAAMEKPHQSS